ncbi:MAG: polysaccharide deacetylase family protein, partial [Acidobacteriaceae bacterium]|nr:polysaccharide deacetylase family protein [Acidobacteriaceae bacterium]
MHQNTIPFNERGGRLRGYLDFISGRFPRFLFGGSVGHDTLPVFHFHDESTDTLEPKLRYLAENGYRTVTNDEIADFVDGRLSSAPRRVGLCFDDAWASVWTTTAPLLRQYGLTAIVYASPGRIEEATDVRPTGPDVTTTGSPFVTWPELRALHASGSIDVQCHTWSHARIFCSPALLDFVTP